MNNHPLPRITPKSWERGNIDPLPLPLTQQRYQQVQPTGRNTPDIFPGSILFGRNFQGNSIAVSTTPVLLVQESYSRPVLILNTTRQSGMCRVLTAFDSILAAAGTTQAIPLDCAGFETCHVHLTITAIAGTWDIYAQSYDSIEGIWYDTQLLFTGLAAVTDSGYTQFGPLGVAEQLAFRFDPTAPGAITCTITCTLKGGTGTGLLGSFGVAYLGGRSVNPVSGFPLLPNQYQIFQFDEGVQMWGVSDTDIAVKTFLL